MNNSSRTQFADQRLERKKSRKCKERGAESRRKKEVVKFGRIAKFLQPAKFPSFALFIMQTTVQVPTTVHFPASCWFFTFFCYIFLFLPILSLVIAFDF